MRLKTLCNKVRCESVMVDEDPNMSDMPAGSYHYRVTLRYKGRQMTVPFSMGPALCHEPTAVEVMDCLLSDALGSDQDFENWAHDLGYDTDSRKAERTYKIVVRQAEKTRRFLGADFDTFMQADR